MRSRNLLHRNKISAFREYAVQNELWNEEKPKGVYEVFRAWKIVKGKRVWAFVYDRSRGDHLTVHGPALGIANRFVHRDTLREGQP